jgi:hypothetical protein
MRRRRTYGIKARTVGCLPRLRYFQDLRQGAGWPWISSWIDRNHMSRPPTARIIVVVLALALVAVLATNFYTARSAKAYTPCIANLRQIEGIKDVWAKEMRKSPGDTPSDADLFGPGRYQLSKPRCPANRVYTLGRVGEEPTCSIGGRNHRLPR